MLHFADLHLGMENYGRIDPETGMHSRLSDFLRSFDELVDFALAPDPVIPVPDRVGDDGDRGRGRAGPVDLALFAGDVYRTRDPSPTHQREFAKRIRRLREAGIPVFLLVGNHDLPNSSGRAHSIEIFETLAVEGVIIADYPRVHRIETRGGPVQIVALPWVLRSMMLTRDEFKNLSLPELNNQMLAKVANVLDHLIAELNPAEPAVLAAHGTVQGASFGSERSVMLGSDLILPPGLVGNRAFDYVALGHIHKHQVLGQQPPVVYAGSLDRIDFGEEHEDKGFVLVELNGRAARWEFIKVHGRPFVTIHAKAESDDPTLDVLAAIARQPIEGAIVRLQIQVPLEKAGLLRDADIRQALKPAWTIATINKEVEEPDRVRLGGGRVEGLTPREALARYLAEKQAPPEHAQRLLERAEVIFIEE
ncbi:MAG: exonuclease SbcCD subunit D [Chloroflexi bacterium]|nr:exonuclease SbcCD subunit D [Chloroflexota bacterium]MBI3734420.1 exonuclease SbcCD subunit D [Chloroflexota bacterium]